MKTFEYCGDLFQVVQVKPLCCFRSYEDQFVQVLTMEFDGTIMVRVRKNVDIAKKLKLLGF